MSQAPFFEASHDSLRHHVRQSRLALTTAIQDRITSEDQILAKFQALKSWSCQKIHESTLLTSIEAKPLENVPNPKDLVLANLVSGMALIASNVFAIEINVENKSDSTITHLEVQNAVSEDSSFTIHKKPKQVLPHQKKNMFVLIPIGNLPSSALVSGSIVDLRLIFSLGDQFWTTSIKGQDCPASPDVQGWIRFAEVLGCHKFLLKTSSQRGDIEKTLTKTFNFLTSDEQSFHSIDPSSVFYQSKIELSSPEKSATLIKFFGNSDQAKALSRLFAGSLAPYKAENKRDQASEKPADVKMVLKNEIGHLMRSLMSSKKFTHTPDPNLSFREQFERLQQLAVENEVSLSVDQYLHLRKTLIPLEAQSDSVLK